MGNPLKSVDYTGLYSPSSCARFGLCDPAINNFNPSPVTAGDIIKTGLFLATLPFGGEGAICEEAGTLTAAERAEIQSIADEFNTQIDVVGSRAAGQGRNIETNLPVGKGLGTRSDIDFITNPQVDINSGGRLSGALQNVGNGAGNILRNTGPAKSPVITFTPEP